MDSATHQKLIRVLHDRAFSRLISLDAICHERGLTKGDIHTEVCTIREAVEDVLALLGHPVRRDQIAGPSGQETDG